MWTCPECKRKFDKKDQVHSCQTIPLGEHFRGKELAKEIYNTLLERINKEIGKCEAISLPCCIHLAGEYEFMAILPKRDRLEIRIGLHRTLSGGRIGQVVPVSQHGYKVCVDLKSATDIDDELMGWLKESYHLRENGE